MRAPLNRSPGGGGHVTRRDSVPSLGVDLQTAAPTGDGAEYINSTAETVRAEICV